MSLHIPEFHQVIAELSKRSFYKFFCEFWDVIESDELILNWHIKYLCDEIQDIAEGVIRGDKENDDLVCNICPGTTKSTIVSVMLPAWLWTRKPDCVVLCNTINTNNATKFSIKFRDIVTSDKYKSCFPYIKVRHDSSAFMRLQNTAGGARRQFTTKGSITGDHGHIRLDDDPMDFFSARSDAESERCIEGYKAYSTRAKKNAYVPYILVAQRLSNQDTPSYVFKVKPSIKKIVLPAWDNGKVYPSELKDNYVDGLLHPKHISQKYLDDKKLELGDLQYLAEFGQDCDTTEGYMYSIKKVPEIEEKGISIAVCDPADDGDCNLASVYAYIHSNKVWIRDIIYTKESSDDKEVDGVVIKKGTITLNIEKAKIYKPYAFFIEKDGMGNIYGKQVKKGYGLVQGFNAKGDKDDRIFSKANVISKHFMFLEQSPHLDYENAVNSMVTYKKVGTNKLKDIQDVLTSLADIAIKNNLINIYI